MKPKILVLDIETSPILGYVWSLWEQNVALNQIKADWNVLAWCAKWVGDKKLHYSDLRHSKNKEDDKALLKPLWDMLNEADIVVTQNGKAFDAKKLNARFVIHGFKPPAPYKHIDTKEMAKKYFAFTSNRLEYMTDKLCKKYKKYQTRKFQGFELWTACLAGNIAAWKEMEKYNKLDVLSTEELYEKLAPWGTPGVNIHTYQEACTCGSTHFQKRGFHFSATGKFQQYQCQECGKWSRGGTSLREKGFAKQMKRGVA